MRQKLPGFFRIGLRGEKSPQVLFLKEIVQAVHQIIELDIGLTGIGNQVPLKNLGLSNLSSNLMFSCAVADEVLFASVRSQPIVFLRPSDDAIFVYVGLRVIVGLQRHYEPFGRKLV